MSDLNARDASGNSALYYAVVNMHLEMVNLLISMGADVNCRCELGNTPLHMAFMTGDKLEKNAQIIKKLI